MAKLFGYLLLTLSGVLALWFAAGWVDGIRRDGLSQTAYTLLHWPAVSLTIALPLLSIALLCVGLSLLAGRKRE